MLSIFQLEMNLWLQLRNLEKCKKEFCLKQSYTWGKGAFGVLGHGDEIDCFLPTKVQVLKDEHVVSVQCGTSHMACLTKDKEFFTWGNNFLGQLGRILQKSKDTDFYPRLVELVQTGPIVSEETLSVSSKFEFVQIECLQFNTLALTKDGKLFSCGKGGTDGSGHGEQPHSLLCLIPDLPKITKIAASSTNHVAVIAGLY
jgi:alpha-tubulin suppressor-like RCC1 family protein